MKKLFTTLSIAACALGIGLVSGYTVAAQKTKPLPISEFKVERSAYDLVYDGLHKQARWVYEYLTADTVQGDVDREKFTFQEDPLIPGILRATLQDYRGSGFDRGHLCPAADCRATDAVMKETFYLSNISPQAPKFNRGYWASLERHVRALARQHGAIHVFTGGLYLPKQEADGKRYVRYQVIGANDVAVPTHFFKAVLDESNALIEAFILPNEPIAAETPLSAFKTTLEKVERAAGIIFNPERRGQ